MQLYSDEVNFSLTISSQFVCEDLPSITGLPYVAVGIQANSLHTPTIY